jgi:hypothetical protein
MAATAALLGYGSKFAIESDDSPNVYTELAEIKSITPPSSNVDQIDVTHMQSPDRRREFISGLIDSGECSFEMNFIPGSASDLRLFELLNLPVGESRRRSCRITFPNNATYTFDAELQNYEPQAEVDGAMVATVTWKVTGAVVFEGPNSPPA